MEVSRKAILSKTHYGLNVYAFILQHYYQNETVLSISGKDCKPTRNPFNSGKPTLLVKIVNNCAEHTDLDNAIAPGNVFDFASLHFSLSGQELLNKLNEILRLRIGESNRFSNESTPQTIVIAPKVSKQIIPQFSFFNMPVSNINPAKEIMLTEVYKLIKGTSFAEQTKTLRSISEPKEARKFKAAHFDYVTFSGTFSIRNDKNLRKHSGLLTIDFDHIAEINALKHELLKDQYFETELLFVSPSGYGLKWIIQIELTKVKHRDYFKAVANYIQQAYKLEIDQSGKDISRACFLPYDPQVFINPKYL